MSRFISNYDLYSSRKPLKFVLVILPRDEGRNLKHFQILLLNEKPKQPSALIEILKFVNYKYIIPALEINNNKNGSTTFIRKYKVLIQKNYLG